MIIINKIIKFYRGLTITCDICFEEYDGDNHDCCPYCNNSPD